MHFAPDTEDVLVFNVALANTAPTASRSGLDELSTRAQLDAMLERFRYTGRFDRDDAELADVVATRDRIREIWTLDRDTLAHEVNAMLQAATASPWLARHDDYDWHLHATSNDAPLGERIGAESALALVDVIRTNETDRLRRCAATDCDGLLADLSRNGSRRFCSVRCGNRMNMVAFRERRATD
ncbi:CGNR zinc finger domain-containing protein [Marisediminicola sp. LYQ134]|uniref:CGNR zinc finger domain-containing protein n=1 Tax=unclassified Marisediminicola TaxID=2618316 RepID=UPI00398353A6